MYYIIKVNDLYYKGMNRNYPNTYDLTSNILFSYKFHSYYECLYVAKIVNGLIIKVDEEEKE